MERILIDENRNKAQEFRKDCQEVMEGASELLATFHAFQEFKRILTLTDAEALIKDPVSYFDQTLRENAGMTMKGRVPDPAALASLFSIERDNYIAIIQGQRIINECTPCHKLVIRKAGKPAISFHTYSLYRSFLTFENGSFGLNDEAIDTECKSFAVYAEQPEAIELHQHFSSLMDLLNKHDEKYHLSNPDKQIIAKSLHLHLAEAYQGKFMLNRQYIVNEIQSLKYQKQ